MMSLIDELEEGLFEAMKIRETGRHGSES